MNMEKAQLKMLITNDLGADIEDRLEGERKAAHELAGAAQALRQAAKKIPTDLIARLEQDQEGDKAIKDGLEAHLVIQLIKQYLTRVGDFLNHLADVEQQKAVAQGGRVAGVESAMEMLKKIRDTEALKIQQLIALAKQAEETGTDIRTAASAARAEHGTAADRKAAEQHAEELPKPVLKKRGKKKNG